MFVPLPHANAHHTTPQALKPFFCGDETWDAKLSSTKEQLLTQAKGSRWFKCFWGCNLPSWNYRCPYMIHFCPWVCAGEPMGGVVVSDMNIVCLFH